MENIGVVIEFMWVFYFILNSVPYHTFTRSNLLTISTKANYRQYTVAIY